MNITEEQIEFLNDLRDNGYTNMMGVGADIQAEFDVDRREAKRILFAWFDYCKANATKEKA